jgi:hypothetical protein
MPNTITNPIRKRKKKQTRKRKRGKRNTLNQQQPNAAKQNKQRCLKQQPSTNKSTEGRSGLYLLKEPSTETATKTRPLRMVEGSTK